MKGLLFALAGQFCILGMVVSAARPQWFRIHGVVPSRWKIGGAWFALALVCAIGALASGFEPDRAPTEWVETTTVEPAVMDIAVPVEIEAPGIQDASRPALPDPALRPPARR
ncbi:hypothetical protein [Variovorax sp. UMC13]|jgi:hypothetical protein|uniref:hypothetical protein n=1 Tax=Variovorax sp. UMC13 TaxID=1862326 RepID=UPI001603AF99|nr:hypothetical protein [Variovorax sp. UMC13]MBB1602679.1 hypothetical protein [Variovorax sp. UMC13]